MDEMNDIAGHFSDEIWRTQSTSYSFPVLYRLIEAEDKKVLVQKKTRADWLSKLHLHARPRIMSLPTPRSVGILVVACHEWGKAYWVTLTSILALLVSVISGSDVSQHCKFPAIYNFGDSNSDTGGISAALGEIPLPYGETYFHRPSGRAGDGRLVIDFIAEDLRLPYLSAYLDSINANFRHGANFATGGSSIRPGGYSPFHLGIQISQFIQFKSRTNAIYSQQSSRGKFGLSKSHLPRPQDFSKALYTMDIGQNDLAYGFQYTNEQEVLSSIPDIIDQFTNATQQLYKEGARAFWIHNTGPLGCLPNTLLPYEPKSGNLDHTGCVEPINRAAREFNQQLEKRVSKLRLELPDASFTYVDMYSAKYALISHAKGQGFVDPFEFCCGSYYGYQVNCGKTAIVNGTVYGNPCPHPSSYISWDGIHYTEAANRWIAEHILNGLFSSPPVPIRKACHVSRGM
ncbi:hypothetical protein Ancab_025760 [Ancistrocladus abbreviatus]